MTPFLPKTCEQQESLSDEKKYTEQDMLAAFKHGNKFEPYQIEGVTYNEVDPLSIPEKNRPFWEWLRLRDTEKIQAEISVLKKRIKSGDDFGVG